MPEDTRLTEQDAAHLLRRAAFGPRGSEVRKWAGKKRRTERALQRMIEDWIAAGAPGSGFVSAQGCQPAP